MLFILKYIFIGYKAVKANFKWQLNFILHNNYEKGGKKKMFKIG